MGYSGMKRKKIEEIGGSDIGMYIRSCRCPELSWGDN